MTQFRVILLLNDLAFSSATLATARVTALSVIGTLATQR